MPGVRLMVAMAAERSFALGNASGALASNRVFVAFAREFWNLCDGALEGAP